MLPPLCTPGGPIFAPPADMTSPHAIPPADIQPTLMIDVGQDDGCCGRGLSLVGGDFKLPAPKTGSFSERFEKQIGHPSLTC
mmetsp:Transcript_4882/g.8547  ORF Transcript_4882/g.8547 Transcript_4882/m.8547 type:complete len:82 (-) Transcript_4882:312-557(-)